MNRRNNIFKLFFYCLSTYFINAISVGFPPGPQSSECALNYSSFPYQASGDCISTYKKIKAWGGFPTTLCCRNALSTISQALALNSKFDNNHNLFLSQNQWNSCIINTSFSQLQSLASFHSCQFDNLYFENSPCTSVSLATIKGIEGYQDAVNKCGNLGSSFDQTCNQCADAVLVLRDNLLEHVRERKNKGERGVCAVASVIAIGAQIPQDPTSLNDFYSCLHTLDVLDHHGYIKIKASLLNALLAILLALVGLFMTIKLVRYVTKHNQDSIKKLHKKEITTWSGLYRFSKEEIEKSITSCPDKKSLGRGSAGQVYKGILPSGQVVAIKKIYKSNMSESFSREVDQLSRIRHPNLVCLFGCCVEDGEQYLVYEYCSNGNLAEHLLRKDKVLPWDKRVKILRDCALALKFLHLHVDGCIVHRDFKLTNILLTDEMDAKLSDFGLARMLNMDETKVFTDVRGTIGYMDPEYMINAKLTCASDIYSFGIVALQLLSGQKVIELDLEARDQLTRKAKDVNMQKRPLSDFIDPRLIGSVDLRDFESILQIAVLCVAKSSIGRPKIHVVFEEMERAWKHTQRQIQRGKKEMSTSAISDSASFDDIQV